MTITLRALLALSFLLSLGGCPTPRGARGDDDDATSDDDDATADDDDATADDDDATADDDDATADDDDTAPAFAADTVTFGSEFTVDGTTLTGVTTVTFMQGQQTMVCQQTWSHGGTVTPAPIALCPDCEAQLTTTGHTNTTTPGSCDPPAAMDIAQGGPGLDAMFGERYVIAWDNADTLGMLSDPVPGVGQSWTQIAQAVGPQYGTPTHLILGDYSALGLAGSYQDTNLSVVGIVFNDGATSTGGMAGDYSVFMILGVQFQ